MCSFYPTGRNFTGKHLAYVYLHMPNEERESPSYVAMKGKAILQLLAIVACNWDRKGNPTKLESKQQQQQQQRKVNYKKGGNGVID